MAKLKNNIISMIKIKIKNQIIATLNRRDYFSELHICSNFSQTNIFFNYLFV